MMVEDKISSLELSLEQKQDTVCLLQTELAQTRQRMQEERTLSESRLLELETRLLGAEEEKTALSKERADNIFQLKQMNRALRTSLNHIKSLRSVLEGVSPLPNLLQDSTSSLYALLNKDTTPTASSSRLKDLQLCLANLREEFSLQSNTPSVTPSFPTSPLHSPLPSITP